jgi:hypothetical protein
MLIVNGIEIKNIYLCRGLMNDIEELFHVGFRLSNHDIVEVKYRHDHSSCEFRRR